MKLQNHLIHEKHEIIVGAGHARERGGITAALVAWFSRAWPAPTKS